MHTGAALKTPSPRHFYESDRSTRFAPYRPLVGLTKRQLLVIEQGVRSSPLTCDDPDRDLTVHFSRAPPGHRGVVHGQDAARLEEPQYTCGGKISDPEGGGAPPCNETLHILRNTPPEYQGGIDPAPAVCRLMQLEQAVLVDIGLVRLPAWLSSPGATLSLRQLSFGANRRLQQFPPEISILQNLNLLSCSACAMEGAVPDSVVALTQLQCLYLDRNRFTELPAGLALITSLRRLELHDNRLKLSIAPTVRVMSWLHYLSLHGNPDVTAQVPSQVLMRAYLDRDVLPLLALLAMPSLLMSQAPGPVDPLSPTF